MYPLFHVFFPLACVIAARLDIRLKLDRLSLAIALILPDLIDKTLMWTIGTTGRDWAHCLLFVGIAGVPFVLARRLAIARSIWLGCLIHLLLDLPYVPWLFPFVQYNFPFHEYSNFWDYFMIGLSQPIVWSTELIGLACLIWLIVRYRLTSISRIKAFLKPDLNETGEKVSEKGLDKA